MLTPDESGDLERLVRRHIERHGGDPLASLAVLRVEPRVQQDLGRLDDADVHTSLSALPAVGLPGTGGRGTVQGGAVESSTVDIATEFTNLIQTQQAYSAASKIITTADQMLTSLLNVIQG